MSKFITVPICYATYRVDDEVLAIVGAQVQTPPALVLETLCYEGKAVRQSILHTLHIQPPDEEAPSDDTHGLWGPQEE